MNIWQLKVFCAVARIRSLSGAARILYLSQPAVSAQILSLELHFNTRLLQRHRHGVSLTPAGQVVYEHANRVLALLEEMEKAVIAAERLHHFSLALTRQVEKVSLAQTIQGFLQANPSLDVELEILPAREVLSGVGAGASTSESSPAEKGLRLPRCRHPGLAARPPRRRTCAKSP